MGKLVSTMATSPAAEQSLSRKLPEETLRAWLRQMMLIREFEVRAMQAYQNKRIGGFLHVYIGQEAVAVGAIAAARPDDPVITAYRDHGHALARGTDARHCMAELYGRVGGCAKGKGGSMHFFDRARHFYGGHGIVGAQCPLGVGIAFATRYQDEVIDEGRSRRVTLCFLGDGALNQGAFHEAINLAGVLDLPLVFAVENNGYAMGTAVARGTTMADRLTAKAGAYGIASAVVDGMDVLAVYDAFKTAIEECRRTVRPCLLEVRTYRYKGHSMSDPRKYRTRDEEERFEAQDPIDRLAGYLMTERALGSEEYEELVGEIKQEIREAIEYAEASPEPDPSELYTDVYTDQWGPYRGTSPPEMLRGDVRGAPFLTTRRPGPPDVPPDRVP
jgi:pyruvate dehydrogenase E1 component alpha subunit